jgi:hypothetical protein
MNSCIMITSQANNTTENDMNNHEAILAILPALKVRMQNNDWPAGRNQPDVYNLDVMNANLRVEGRMYRELKDQGLGEHAHQAFCAYAQIHELVDCVWDESRAYQLLQAIVRTDERDYDGGKHDAWSDECKMATARL